MGVSGVLAAVLLVATIASYRGALALAETVVRGQASLIAAALRRQLPATGRPGPDAFASFLASQADVGLRFIAIVRGDGEVRALAGEPLDADAGIPPPDNPLIVGERVRIAVPVPPRAHSARPFGVGGEGPDGHPPNGHPPDGHPPDGHPPDGKRSGPPMGPPGGKRGGPPFGRPPPGWRGDVKGIPGPLLLLEFEPLQLAALQNRAQRDLAIGLVGAGALLLIAAGLFSTMRRAERAEARLVEKRHLESLGEMSAVLAHELRNPLASLKGHAQLLAEQLPEGRPQAKAERVVSETVRLQDLIESLLTFVRSGRIDRRPCDPAALCRSVAQRFADRPVKVRVDADDAPATWSLDPDRIEQVLTNLIDNAIGADPGAEQPVVVTVSTAEGSLLVAVADHGPGIAPEIRDTLFAPFATAGKTRGVGLGLAVARRVVEAHGGTITARDNQPTDARQRDRQHANDNRSTRGARFEVRLPQG